MSAGLKGGAAAPSSEQALSRAPLRFVSAASLFDGHDAAINMIRRLLQARGAEVVHLGHNRSVADIVRAAIDEDADAVAVSSYQGGHNEYFAYMVDMLRERGCEHIRVVVGGGGTIAPQEIEALERHGVEKIYTPEDGRRMGLAGMIEDVLRRIAAVRKPAYELRPLNARDHALIARSISVLEGAAGVGGADAEQIRRAVARSRRKAPVIGITGTGGAGKSSLTDELLTRLARQFPQAQIAVVAMDPTRRRSGGALLGDRIRMNSLSADNIYMRSLATRRAHLATAAVLKDVIELYQAAGFDLAIVETAGIGQSDSEIVELVDLSLYVMTSEYGAASQLEKIEMLDYADLIVLNKSEKRGAEDSLRDVRKQWRRNHPGQGQLPDAQLPGKSAPLPGRSRTRAPPSSRRARRWCRGRARATWRKSPRRAVPRARASRRRHKPRAAPAVCTRPSRRCTRPPCPRRSSPLRPQRSPMRARMPRAASCAPPTTARSPRSAPRAWRSSRPGRRACARPPTPPIHTRCASAW